MTSQLQPLTSLLEKQVTLQQQADTLLKRLKRALISGDTESIMSINEQLLTLGKTIKQTEQERQQWLHEKGYGNQSLKDMLPNLPASEQKNVTQLRHRLRKTIETVQREKAETDTLIQQSMDWVHQTVKNIADQIQPQQTNQQAYGPNTTSKKTHGSQPTVQAIRKSIIERKA